MAAPAITTDAATEKPPRSRRWIPLSLQMFAAMLLILGVAGVLRVGIPAYRQQVAFRVIEAAGGYIEPVRGGPDWLRRWAGDEWMKVFDEVGHAIELDDRHVGDAEVASLAG